MNARRIAVALLQTTEADTHSEVQAGSTQFSGYINLGGIVTNNPVTSGSSDLRPDEVINEVIVRGTGGNLFNRIERANFTIDPYVAFPGSVVVG